MPPATPTTSHCITSTMSRSTTPTLSNKGLEMIHISRSPTPPPCKNKQTKHNTPHLPKDLLKDMLREKAMQGLESLVFGDKMRKIRIRLTDVNSDDQVSPDASELADEVDPEGRTVRGRTLLHLAVSLSDHLLVLESIRLGVSVDKRDAGGRTPLSVALDMWQRSLQSGVPSKFVRYPPQAFWERLRCISYALIRQHVNLDLTVEGSSYLHRACTIQDWGLINMLLEYRASHAPTRVSKTTRAPVMLLSPDDRPAFRHLVLQYAKKPRPARICPCWSGKPLDKCHRKKTGSGESYPTYFRCICGSGRPYSVCSCSKRSMQISERYREEEHRIVAQFDRDVPFHPSILGERYPLKTDPVSRAMMELLEGLYPLLGVERPTTPEAIAKHEEGLQRIRKMADELVVKGEVDPAYAYALHRAPFSPRPVGRQTDKKGMKKEQDIWNAFVDQYIELGIDERPRIEIERAAKIGLAHGPLHRRCDNPLCAKMAGRDGVTLRECARCKILVFCSKQCQAFMWESHKEECGSPHLREQMLDSQNAMFMGVRPLIVKNMKRVLQSEEGKDYPGLKEVRGVIEHLQNKTRMNQELRQRSVIYRDRLLALRHNRITFDEMINTPLPS